MKFFQVGGSVRDELLGFRPKDRDWVVINSSPNEMEQNGFKPIGKDFPVFIHPDTNEEYALEYFLGKETLVVMKPNSQEAWLFSRIDN